MDKHGGVRSDLFWEFAPGQKVMTIDNLPGKVVAVHDGPFPGAEDYEVVLDNGMGGGTYTSGQLAPKNQAVAVAHSALDYIAAEQVLAAGHHLATEDYPELGTVLHDRPDPGQLSTMAAKSDGDFTFQHTETDIGGTKFPRRADLTAHHPDTGEQVGSVRYFPPKRKSAPVHIDEVRGGAPGAASALLNEVEARHPGSRMQFLHEVKRNNNSPSVTGHEANGAGDPSDWDAHHPQLADIVHRGLSLRMPASAARVLNSSGSSKEDHLAQLHEAIPQGPSVGMHWTEDEHSARQFAHNGVSDYRSDIPVVLHARAPARKDLETRQQHLYRGGVFPYGHSHSQENEVPLRKGRKVEVTGISWRPDVAHPDADEDGWMHHSYAEPIRHTATQQGGYRDEVHPVEHLMAVRMNHDVNGDYVDRLADHLSQHGLGDNHVTVEETNGGPLLTDGHHLLEAADRVGIRHLPARVYENTPEGRSAATRAIVESERAKETGHSRMAVRTVAADLAEGAELRDTDQPDSCSYCGGTEFTGQTDNGRVRQATCAICGGTMSAHPGTQWQPELTGDPSNHPKTTVDSRSGASPTGTPPGINDSENRSYRLGSLVFTAEQLGLFDKPEQRQPVSHVPEHVLDPVPQDGYEDHGHLCEHCGFSTRHPDHGEQHDDWRNEQRWHTDWSIHPNVAKSFSRTSPRDERGMPDPYDFSQDPRSTRVVLHAQTPDPSRMLRGERSMKDQGIFGIDHGEGEVPLKKNTPLHINGISFGNGDELERHDFPEGMRMKASLEKEAAVDGPDWCTWRVAAQCTFPNDRNSTLLAIPQVRGACPWTTRWEQQVCPISEPGPGAGVSHKATQHEAGGAARNPKNRARNQDLEGVAGSHVFRGLHGEGAHDYADAHFSGQAEGGGDWGKGLYVARTPTLAIGYAKTHASDKGGVVLHGQIHPDAKVIHTDAMPAKIRTERARQSDWARQRGYGVVTDGIVHLITDPKAIKWEPKKYTPDEAYHHFDKYGDHHQPPDDLFEQHREASVSLPMRVDSSNQHTAALEARMANGETDRQKFVMDVQRAVDKASEQEHGKHQDDAKYSENYDPLHKSDLHQDRQKQFGFHHNTSEEHNLFKDLLPQNPELGVGPHGAPVNLTHYKSPITMEPLHLDEHGNSWRRHYAWPHPDAKTPEFRGWSGPHSATETLDEHPTWSVSQDAQGNHQQHMRSHSEREQMTGTLPGETHGEIVRRRNKALSEGGWSVVSAMGRLSSQMREKLGPGSGNVVQTQSPSPIKVTSANDEWFHGSRHVFHPGDTLTGGHARSNQGYGQPADHVYYSGRRDVASFFAEAGDGPDHDPDARPRVYRVQPLEGHEQDPDEDKQLRSFRAPKVKVLGETHFDHEGYEKLHEGDD
jgi:hypothetical protein